MDDFRRLVNRETRLIAVSHVQYANGYRIDLEELSNIAHENNALLLTDAVQSVGQMPIEVSKLGIDFLAASGYKWLLSPISTGFLYVKLKQLDDLWPTIVGYRSDQNSNQFGYREFQPAQSARRFEDGQLNFPGFAGMKESITMLREVGIQTIWSRICMLINRLVEGLENNRNARVTSSLEDNTRSGIVNIACRDPRAVAERLLKSEIVVSVRDYGVRISPHFYNTEGEVDRLLTELSNI